MFIIAEFEVLARARCPPSAVRHLLSASRFPLRASSVPIQLVGPCRV